MPGDLGDVTAGDTDVAGRVRRWGRRAVVDDHLVGQFPHPVSLVRLGPVSKSRSMRVAPEVVPGGAAGRPAYRCCMWAVRPCPQGPPQARLSRTRTSIQALVPP